MASHVYRFVSRLAPYSNRTGQNVSANAIEYLFLSYYQTYQKVDRKNIVMLVRS